jgi:hypothetical protein
MSTRFFASANPVFSRLSRPFHHFTTATNRKTGLYKTGADFAI